MCACVCVCVCDCLCVCVCVCVCVCEVFLPSVASATESSRRPFRTPGNAHQVDAVSVFLPLRKKKKKSLGKKKGMNSDQLVRVYLHIAACRVAEKPASSPRKCVLKTHILGDMMLIYFLIYTKFICLHLFPARSGRL